MKNAWPIVAVREITVRLTDRNFIYPTLITIVLLLGLFVVQGFLMGGSTDYEVAVADDDGASVVATAEQTLQAQDAEAVIGQLRVDGPDAVEAAVTEGDVDAGLVRADSGWELVVDGEANSTLEGALAGTVRTEMLTANAEAAGTSSEELMAGTELSVRDVSGADSQERLIAFLAGLVMAAVFYMSAIFFGMAIAGSVVEEKQSRIIEILSAAVPVRQLLTGKVIGSTVLAFVQMAVIGAVGLIGLSFTEYDAFLPALTTGFLWYIPFFVFGFLALACIWAAAGAMASRQEDLQSTTMPVTMALVLIFVVGLSLEGASQVIGSYVPVLSTILMPMRLLEGSAEWWEAVLALGLTVGFCLLTIGVGTRLYRRSLLQTQGRVSLRSAWSGGE